MSYKEKLERRAGGQKGQGLGWSTVDPQRYCCATLINRKSTTVQAPGRADLGLSEATQRVTR